MSRAVSNLLIVLATAIVVTAVLAFTSNDVRFDDAAGVDELPAPETTRTTIEPATDGAESAEEADESALEPAAQDDSQDTADPTSDDGTDTATDEDAAAPVAADDASEQADETPSYLDPEPTEEGTETAEVLGATQAQETEPESLADTGGGLLGQWIILATGIAATGGIVRNAGRDHAEGELTLLP